MQALAVYNIRQNWVSSCILLTLFTNTVLFTSMLPPTLASRGGSGRSFSFRFSGRRFFLPPSPKTRKKTKQITKKLPVLEQYQTKRSMTNMTGK